MADRELIEMEVLFASCALRKRVSISAIVSLIITFPQMSISHKFALVLSNYLVAFSRNGIPSAFKRACPS